MRWLPPNRLWFRSSASTTPWRGSPTSSETIGLVQERLNPNLKVEGIVLTMFDGRTSLAGQVRAEVQRHLGKQIMTTMIPRNIRLSEAPSHGKPIMLYDLRSAGSTAYLDLAREVISHG